MIRFFIRLAALCGFALAAITPVFSQSPTKPVIYKLDKDTLFQRGCFGPCLCAMQISSRMRGTFVLTHTGSDPLFEHYSVTDVNWFVLQNGNRIPIKGSGTYKVGGEFAVQQQLSLDLVVGTDPVEHYDSGLVTGPSDFPRINLTISIHGGSCLDTVITLRSRPAMLISMNGPGLSWDSVPQATGYDIVAGDLRALRASGGDFSRSTFACVAANTPATSLILGSQPPPGEGFWFLARWVEASGRDSYDEDDPAQMGTCDAAIKAAPASCP